MAGRRLPGRHSGCGSPLHAAHRAVRLRHLQRPGQSENLGPSFNNQANMPLRPFKQKRPHSSSLSLSLSPSPWFYSLFKSHALGRGHSPGSADHHGTPPRDSGHASCTPHQLFCHPQSCQDPPPSSQQTDAQAPARCGQVTLPCPSAQALAHRGQAAPRDGALHAGTAAQTSCPAPRDHPILTLPTASAWASVRAEGTADCGVGPGGQVGGTLLSSEGGGTWSWRGSRQQGGTRSILIRTDSQADKQIRGRDPGWPEPEAPHGLRVQLCHRPGGGAAAGTPHHVSRTKQNLGFGSPLCHSSCGDLGQVLSVPTL